MEEPNSQTNKPQQIQNNGDSEDKEQVDQYLLAFAKLLPTIETGTMEGGNPIETPFIPFDDEPSLNGSEETDENTE